MKFIVLILLLLISNASVAQSSLPASREINQLFTALENSKCEFNRNGSWYSTQDASEHLRKKYDYLLKKHMLTSTESFIDLGASKSSMSGKPYLVRCGKAEPVTSKRWFTDKLKQLRGSAGGADN